MQFTHRHTLLLKNIQGISSLRRENLCVLQFAIGEILPKHCVTDFKCLRCGSRMQSYGRWYQPWTALLFISCCMPGCICFIDLTPQILSPIFTWTSKQTSLSKMRNALILMEVAGPEQQPFLIVQWPAWASLRPAFEVTSYAWSEVAFELHHQGLHCNISWPGWSLGLQAPVHHEGQAHTQGLQGHSTHCSTHACKPCNPSGVHPHSAGAAQAWQSQQAVELCFLRKFLQGLPCLQLGQHRCPDGLAPSAPIW